jgi:hypothetical protein
VLLLLHCYRRCWWDGEIGKLMLRLGVGWVGDVRIWGMSIHEGQGKRGWRLAGCLFSFALAQSIRCFYKDLACV